MGDSLGISIRIRAAPATYGRTGSSLAFWERTTCGRHWLTWIGTRRGPEWLSMRQITAGRVPQRISPAWTRADCSTWIGGGDKGAARTGMRARNVGFPADVPPTRMSALQAGKPAPRSFDPVPRTPRNSRVFDPHRKRLSGGTFIEDFAFSRSWPVHGVHHVPVTFKTGTG